MSAIFDAIIIGAGHNGLVAAAMLARKGRRVLVLESRNHVGGMLGDAQFRVASMPSPLNPKVAKALGIKLKSHPMQTIVAAGDGSLTHIRGAMVSGADAADAAAYARLHESLIAKARALSPMLTMTPPGLDRTGWRQWLTLCHTGMNLRRLGKSQLRELMRIALSNVHDLVLDEMPDGPLAGAMAMDATLGGAMGPRSPGTVLSLLYRMTHANAATGPDQAIRHMPDGGPQAMIDALCAVVTQSGGDIRTSAAVAKILVEDDQACGVALASGEEIRAHQVLSNAAPATTLIKLLGPGHLDAEFVRRCRNIASRGMVARLDFDLAATPELSDGSAMNQLQRLISTDGSTAIEQAFDTAKHGRLPDRPTLESCFDPGNQRLSVTAQFVPAMPDGGWSTGLRNQLGKTVLATLEPALPGLGKLVQACRIMTPGDIETGYHVPGGHWHHGEFRIDQALMLRPFDGAGQYRMPVRGLYLCGAGSHPGGDISGTPGFNAANAALSDGGK
ncbi:MAG: NAD(P)/FAD-dependent oxidoreductase [Nitratireductor sp.]